MIRGVRNLVNFGFSLEDAVKTAGFNPAQVMRYRNKGAIIPGHDADLVVFAWSAGAEDGKSSLRVLAAISGGIIRKNILTEEFLCA
jgi:N-acetylglucosamine-6-phosphate deacetylase